MSTGENRHGRFRQFVLAILAAAGALLLRGLLNPLLGENNPYHTVWAAVFFSAWYCGLWPSIVTTLLSLIGVWFWFLPPARSWALEDPRTAIFGMVGFVVFSGLIIALSEGNRRSLARREWAEEELRRAHADLEIKVAERTVELNQANESLRELSSRLQELRDDERRQIARELHDSVGQLLAALTINLDQLTRQAGGLDAAAVGSIVDSRAMVSRINSEIRTISHLLHPPLLDAAGLASALHWYVDEFSERSKIKVELDIVSDIGRLADAVEIAIFRMIQECLTNIHRHSESTSAAIRISREGSGIVVQVRDSGKGIPPEKTLALQTSGRSGVGFRGMRERLRHLGGTLEIESDATGTCVTATLPTSYIKVQDTEAEIA